MKHPSTRELFLYWDSQRGSRPLPDRNEIEPGAIRSALGDVFILGMDEKAGHPFRLAGTRVCALFGREMRGESFLNLWPSAQTDRNGVRNLLSIAAAESLGFVAAATGGASGGDKLQLELVVLPLRHRGRTDARLIGVLAPLKQPDWSSFGRIDWLELGSYRFLSVPARDAQASLRAQAAVFRLRHGFPVFDGQAANRPLERDRLPQLNHE